MSDNKPAEIQGATSETDCTCTHSIENHWRGVHGAKECGVRGCRCTKYVSKPLHAPSITIPNGMIEAVQRDNNYAEADDHIKRIARAILRWQEEQQISVESTEPLPCSFCQSIKVRTAESNLIAWIVCEGCGAFGPEASTIPEAIVKWNGAKRS